MVLEFIKQYWLEFLLSLVSAGFVALARYFQKLYKKEKTRTADDEHNKLVVEFKNLIEEEHKTTQVLLDQEKVEFGLQENVLKESIAAVDQKTEKLGQQLATITSGILAVQGRAFKADCRALLDSNHTITLAEFEQITCDHETYNSLGGNHQGDSLYKLVETKYKSGLDN